MTIRWSDCPRHLGFLSVERLSRQPVGVTGVYKIRRCRANKASWEKICFPQSHQQLNDLHFCRFTGSPDDYAAWRISNVDSLVNRWFSQIPTSVAAHNSIDKDTVGVKLKSEECQTASVVWGRYNKKRTCKKGHFSSCFRLHCTIWQKCPLQGQVLHELSEADKRKNGQHSNRTLAVENIKSDGFKAHV